MLAPNLLNRLNRGSRYPAVIDVPNYGHLQTREFLLVPQNGIGVEQRLGGMLVHSVSGMITGISKMAGIKWGAPALGWRTIMTSAPTARRVYCSIEQRFPFFDARSTRKNKSCGRTRALSGDFERRAGACGGFVEEQQHSPSAKQGGPIRVELASELEYPLTSDAGIPSILSTDPRVAVLRPWAVRVSVHRVSVP